MPKGKWSDEKDALGLAQKFKNLPQNIQDEIKAYMEDKRTPLSEEAQVALWTVIIPLLLEKYGDDLVAGDVDE